MTESPRKNLKRSVFYPKNATREHIWIVSTNLHLADKPVLVNSPALAALRLLSPHLFDILQDHVAVTVEGLDPSK
jgi:hypothetical protein